MVAVVVGRKVSGGVLLFRGSLMGGFDPGCFYCWFRTRICVQFRFLQSYPKLRLQAKYLGSRKIFLVSARGLMLWRELEIENLMASLKNPDFEVVVPDEGCVKSESLLL